MFMLIFFAKEKSDFYEVKHFFIKNYLRKGYKGVFHGGNFLK